MACDQESASTENRQDELTAPSSFQPWFDFPDGMQSVGGDYPTPFDHISFLIRLDIPVGNNTS